jgi:hypothetical protein
MSLRMRGKQIAPVSETVKSSSEANPNDPNNNVVQRLKMWGVLVSDLFKVVMACLLSVFVPQNCPPSETFDKEVRVAARAAAATSSITPLLIVSLQYWHPCEVQENLTELDPYNTCAPTLLPSSRSRHAPPCQVPQSCKNNSFPFSSQVCHHRELLHVLRLLRPVLCRIPTRDVFD